MSHSNNQIANAIYAGIGSREAPEHVKQLMMKVAQSLAGQGWTLRSGAAPGADKAFEIGCDQAQGTKEIYIPWRGFDGRLNGPEIIMSNSVLPNLQEAYNLAARFHPMWHRCSKGAKKLHTRNMYQILGRDLESPVRVVICWTKNGAGKGGTGQALRLAQFLDIEIHDLGKPDVLADYEQHFKD